MTYGSVTEVSDLERLLKSKGKLLCLFSGGLDSTYLLYLLKASGVQNRIVALTVAVGGGDDGRARTIAEHFGIDWLGIDRTDRFATDFVAPSIAATACYLGGHPISASLSRPCIAQAAVEIANELECSAILHTSTRSQNSLRRYNNTIRDLGFRGEFGSVFERSTVSRGEKIAALEMAGLNGFGARKYSVDENLWCRSIESGELDDPETVMSIDELFGGIDSEKQPCEISMSFRSGIPVSLNGEPLALLSLLNTLQRVVQRYRLGRYVGLEEIEGGLKVQEFHEAPLAAVLFDAYRRLESAVTSAECIREKLLIEQVWVREAVEGRWFGTLRQAADAFIQSVAGSVSGDIVYELHDRYFGLRSMVAINPIYVRNRDSFESEMSRDRQ